MSRELKFRAWDGEIMIPFEGLLEMPLHQLNGNGMLTIMQFTGVKDRLNNDIYEGDILTMLRKRRHSIAPRYFQFKWFERHAGYFITSIEDTGKESLGMPLPGSEFYDFPNIVGNIYQHRHLLNQGTNLERSVATQAKSNIKS